MTTRSNAILICLLAAVSITGCSAQPAEGNLHLIDLPEGFKIEIYAEDVPNARSMALGEDGTLYVGSRTAGNVYALLDTNQDNTIDKRITLAMALRQPNGVAVKDGDLYFAEISKVWRIRDIASKLQDNPEKELVFDKLPNDEHHGWKYIAFGPDGKLYVPIGAPCNVCDEEDERYSTITRINDDGTGFEIYAHGVRNTVGFDWHPETGEMWFTDNGRDWLGDDLPPDELNRAPTPGLHFGFPYCHGGEWLDPEYGEGKSCEDYESPVQNLGPHVAALGMTFYTGEMFPAEYRGHVFIAEHGSWNRSTKIGYRVMLVKLDGNRAVSYEPFAEGWLQRGEGVWGRPVDVLQMPDGSLLVSDDYADTIYRISYGE
ncbi:MAG: sorbosone dehydrogenase [Ectothiorhodospiraceae bacterium]|nr:sorbosone dehydrogenase [Ectothiorhodospiraceae bacterium]